MDAKQVILAGAGHAHLYLAARATTYREAGAELTLIDPGRFWYSGMASGLISGRYRDDEDQVDVQALARHHGARHLQDRVVAIDRGERRVLLASGNTLPYALLSLNLGSRCGPLPYTADDDDFLVKPIPGLARLRARVLDQRPARIAVIGAGATGCEVACNLRELVAQRGLRCDIDLLGESLAPELPPAARHALQAYLQAVGIRLRMNTRVTRRAGDTLYATEREIGRYPLRILATGLQAMPLEQTDGMAFDATRGYRVGSTLQTAGDERIFAVGDCADLEGHALPRIGVFGVRQAPVLHDNLLALLQQQALRSYHPQQRYLSILNLGFGQGLAVRGRFWWLGRISMIWKEWLDRRFLRQYQNL